VEDKDILGSTYEYCLSRFAEQKGKTLFIGARNMGSMVNRRLREMTPEDIAKILCEKFIQCENSLSDFFYVMLYYEWQLYRLDLWAVDSFCLRR
jgi:hypothetical protein